MLDSGQREDCRHESGDVIRNDPGAREGERRSDADGWRGRMLSCAKCGRGKPSNVEANTKS